MAYTKEELAYIVGFFDGEGCVCCSFDEQKQIIKSLHLSIANTNIEALKYIQSKIGGSITTTERAKSNWKAAHHLQLSGDTACKFITDALHYSKIKLEQLVIAKLFFETRDSGRSNEVNQFIYNSIRSLNKRGASG